MQSAHVYKPRRQAVCSPEPLDRLGADPSDYKLDGSILLVSWPGCAGRGAEGWGTCGLAATSWQRAAAVRWCRVTRSCQLSWATVLGLSSRSTIKAASRCVGGRRTRNLMYSITGFGFRLPPSVAPHTSISALGAEQPPNQFDVARKPPITAFMMRLLMPVALGAWADIACGPVIGTGPPARSGRRRCCSCRFGVAAAAVLQSSSRSSSIRSSSVEPPACHVDKRMLQWDGREGHDWMLP